MKNDPHLIIQCIIQAAVFIAVVTFIAIGCSLVYQQIKNAPGKPWPESANKSTVILK